jgi:catechol 2,3-dioxygenase
MIAARLRGACPGGRFVLVEGRWSEPSADATLRCVAFGVDETQVLRPAMHHVNLKTTRLQEMVDWYGKVIGAHPNVQTESFAFLTNDRATHRIALTSVPGLKDDDEKIVHTGMHHSAFEYETLDGLLATYLRLKNGGIVPGACLDHGPTTSFYYVDPDGNLVELQADNFGDWEKSAHFARTDAQFTANPIGEYVDPDKLVAARRQGLSPRELHERAYRGEYPPSIPPDFRLPH